MVRQGPVVIAGLGLVLSVAALGQAAAEKKAAPAPAPATASAPGSGKEAAKPEAIEARPYKIRAWVSIDPHAPLDRRGRDAWVAAWKTLVGRFVGPPWQIEVAEGDGPLVVSELEEMQPAAVKPLAAGFDKAWIVRIRPDGAGFSIHGREYDAPTERIGLPCRRAAPYPDDAPRALLDLALEMFLPSAEIGPSSAGGVSLNVQGGLIPAADPIGQVVAPGSTFRAVRIFYKPDKSVLRIDPIRNTYLVVQSVEGGVARCEIMSALRDPLTRRVVGSSKMLALGVKPTALPTRLRFTIDRRYLPTGAVVAGGESPPAAGYILTARATREGVPREVGTTDREGRIVLEPGFAPGLVILRLLAANLEPVAEFPIVPGEQIEERTIAIDPKAAAVTLEARVLALRDEVMDMVAIRSRIEARMKLRADADNWEEVKPLLDEFAKLPSRELYTKQIDAFEKQALDEQAKAKAQSKLVSPVRTKTAANLIAETRAMIEGYLKDDEYNAYKDAYERYLAEKAKTQSQGKGAVMPKISVVGGSAPPAAAKTAAPQAATPPPAQAPTPRPASKPAAKPATPPAGGGIPF